MPNTTERLPLLFVGIDPGLSGAWAVISQDGTLLGVGNVPVECIIGPDNKSIVSKQTDGRVLYEEISQFEGILVAACVERIVIFPKISKIACVSLGDSAAAARIACQWAKIPSIYQPTAALWKKDMGLSKPKKKAGEDVPDVTVETDKKKVALAKARELFPQLPTRFRHDKAEALLMAEYARRRYFLELQSSLETASDV